MDRTGGGDAKLERLAFFSDAVFAIAMTLLVVDVRLPPLAAPDDRALAQALLDLVPNYIGFVISFLVIGRFWVGHHRLLGLLDTADATVIRANLVLLMAIAFMPFPTAVLSNYATLRVAVGLYTGFLLLVGLANVRLIRVVRLRARHPDATQADADWRTLGRTMWAPLVIAVIGFVAGMIAPVAGLVALTLAAPAVLLLFAWWGRRRAAPAASPDAP